MIVRITGAFLLLAAAAALGVGFRTQEQKHIRALARSVNLLYHARRKIDLFSTPSTEIFEDYSDEDGYSIDEEALKRLYASMGGEAEILQSFFEKLGNGYKADTLRLCDHTLAMLEERLQHAEKEYPARIRLYAAMPLLFAVSLIVLFL